MQMTPSIQQSESATTHSAVGWLVGGPGMAPPIVPHTPGFPPPPFLGQMVLVPGIWIQHQYLYQEETQWISQATVSFLEKNQGRWIDPRQSKMDLWNFSLWQGYSQELDGKAPRRYWYWHGHTHRNGVASYPHIFRLALLTQIACCYAISPMFVCPVTQRANTKPDRLSSDESTIQLHTYFPAQFIK